MRAAALLSAALACVVLAFALTGFFVLAPPDGHSYVCVQDQVQDVCIDAYVPRLLRTVAAATAAADTRVRGVLQAVDGCSEARVRPGAVVLVGDGPSCTFVQKLRNVQANASAVIGISSDAFVLGDGVETVVVPAFLVRQDDALEYLDPGMTASVWLADTVLLDPAVWLLLALALLIIALAGAWRTAQIRQDIQAIVDGGLGDAKAMASRDRTGSPIHFSWPIVAVVVVILGVMLALNRLAPAAYNIAAVVLFALLAWAALFECQKTVLNLNQRHPVFSGALLAIDTAAVTVWAVFNQAPYAWIAQDVFGVLIAVKAAQVAIVPNIKIPVILFGVLIVFDVVKEFAFPDIQVDTLNDDPPVPPMPPVLLMPYLMGPGMLSMGLASVVIPACLLMYCRRFDMYKDALHRNRLPQHRTGYFFWGTFGFVVGLLAVAVWMAVNRTVLRTFLFVLPGTLVPVVCVAAYREELAKLWTGVLYDADSSIAQQQRLPILPSTDLNVT